MRALCKRVGVDDTSFNSTAVGVYLYDLNINDVVMQGLWLHDERSFADNRPCPAVAHYSASLVWRWCVKYSAVAWCRLPPLQQILLFFSVKVYWPCWHRRRICEEHVKPACCTSPTEYWCSHTMSVSLPVGRTGFQRHTPTHVVHNISRLYIRGQTDRPTDHQWTGSIRPQHGYFRLMEVLVDQTRKVLRNARLL